MNGLTLLALIALTIGVLVAYRAGARHGRREDSPASPHPLSAGRDASLRPASSTTIAEIGPARQPPRRPPESEPAARGDALTVERARLVRAYEAEVAACARAAWSREAENGRLRSLDEERRSLFVALAEARAETARFREIVIDVENNAPARFLDGPGSADDLKLIVGVGPMLERMLHQLGVTTYRQIAHWTDRDIDEFDHRLPEFPGRIRRDAWVMQARELHHSKYGSAP